jgi:hypothetical protein
LQEIDATTVGPKTSELLAIPRREPLLRIRQVMYSTKRNPIMYWASIALTGTTSSFACSGRLEFFLFPRSVFGKILWLGTPASSDSTANVLRNLSA